MIKISSIDHIVLRTAHTETMVRFYEDILHCQLERVLEDLGLFQLRAGNTLIDIVAADSPLGKKGGEPPTTQGNNMDHFCLRIESVDEQNLINYLHHHHVNYSPFENRYGAEGFGRSIYINDPDKNTIELKFEKSTM